MIASASSNFAGMLTVGMCIEECVRKGRLVKESVSADDFEDEDQEMSMVKSQLQQQYPVYHPVTAVMPIANDVQNPGYKPQFPQYQQQYQPQPQQQALQQLSPQKQAPRTKFDPIPMKYAELLPMLLERNWVQTKCNAHFRLF